MGEAESEQAVNNRKIATILAHAFVGWALCGATMGIGMAVASLQNAVVVHAILAPVFFALVSLFYFRRFGYTAPLQTAGLFVAFVVVIDFFLVGLVINRSLEMFTSLLGTWIPFALIFASTYVTGMVVARAPSGRAAAR